MTASETRLDRAICSCSLTVTSHALLQIANFRHGRVLAAGSKQVAERIEGDATVSFLVEEGEGFFVVGGGLRRRT